MTVGVILAGSHVWQEDSLESICPRPLFPVANVPLIEYTIAWLRHGGVKRAMVCANNLSASLRGYLGDGAAHDMDLYFLDDRMPRGPAGCVRDTAAILHADRYVVVDGAVLPGVGLAEVVETHETSQASATVVVNAKGGLPGQSGTQESPAGIYVFSRDALDVVSDSSYQDIKEILIPTLTKSGKLVRAHLATKPTARLGFLESYIAMQGIVLRDILDGLRSSVGYERQGEALIHASARVANSARLLGPVMVGPRAEVADDAIVVGPSVIGESSKISRRAIIERSVIWSNTVIGEASKISLCLITNNVNVDSSAVKQGLICRRATSVLAEG